MEKLEKRNEVRLSYQIEIINILTSTVKFIEI